MKKLKSHFKFTKQERSGIFFLLLIIVLLQVGYFLFKSFPMDNGEPTLSIDKETQAQIDILKESASPKDTVTIYPFNPNFITDHKGYTLGMSVEEIDRLHAFRKQNNYANSPSEFQKVTLISDSLLKAISTYFKFPEWTQNSKQFKVGSNQYKAERNNSPPTASDESKREEGMGLREDFSERVQIKDLNAATIEDLRSINGIGEILSNRIVKFRDRLGGFLIDEQLYDVYGLEPEVVKRTFKKYKVLHPPKINRINVNSASAEELTKLVYLQKHVAQRIVDYRNLNETIDSLNELINIEDFPAEKIDRIALYLSLK